MIKTKSGITEGPIFYRLFLFTLPIMLTGLLQVTYNIADNIVVGSFSGDDLALAAVGSTTSLTTLIVNFLTGLSAGAGVVIAQTYGAKDMERLDRIMHTTMTFALISGISFAVLAFALSGPALSLMGTKEELFDKAQLYFRIICCGIPASTLYNFGNSALRSLGNSKLPLYILSTSGLINVLLNLVFVIVCGMSVEGVALATVISQYLSAGAVLFLMLRKKNLPYSIRLKNLGINKGLLLRIVRLGAPAGIQSSLFSISNILITSAVNTLPTTAISAKTIAFNIDGLAYTAMNSYLHASMTFVGQNYGAKKPERIKKASLYALIQVTLIGVLIGIILLSFSKPIIGLYIDPANPDKQIITDYTVGLMQLILSCYFLCGILDTLSGILRGLGNSFAPMVIGIIGTCGIRILWIYVFFPMPTFHTLNGLYYCYPITWIFSIIALIGVLLFTWNKKIKILKD